jgi:hypothetical protein
VSKHAHHAHQVKGNHESIGKEDSIKPIFTRGFTMMFESEKPASIAGCSLTSAFVFATVSWLFK